MINYRLGDGVPSSITPKRIKSILRLVKTQERAFEDALDRCAGRIWTSNLADNGFYERIRNLLGSESGRSAYNAAQRRFEENKPKRIGRVDFFKRLKQECISSLPNHDAHSLDGGDVGENSNDIGFPYMAFVRNNKWQQMAEYIWAQCAISKSGDEIATALDKHPQLSEYLSKIEAIPIHTDSDPEKNSESLTKEEPGEVGNLVEFVAEAIGTIEPASLNLDLLTKIHTAVDRLMSISEMRDSSYQRLQSVKSRISSWEERYSEEISNAPELKGYLASLLTLIEDSELAENQLDSVFVELQQQIDIITQINAARAEVDKALNASNYQALSKESDKLAALELKRTTSLAVIEGEMRQLAETSSSDQISVAANDASANEDDKRSEQQETLQSDGQGASVEPTADGTENTLPFQDDASSDVHNAHVKNSGDSASDSEAMFNQTSSDQTLVSSAHEIIVREICASRYAIAYHLAKAISSVVPSPSAIHLVASNYVSHDRDLVAAEFPQIAHEVATDLRTISQNGIAADWVHSFCAMIAVATLGPARISTGGPVAQLLLSLEPHLRNYECLLKIVKKAAEVSLNGLQIYSLPAVGEDAEERWNNRHRELLAETDKWLSVAKRATIRYKPATDVWRRLLEDWKHEERESVGSLFSNFLSSSVAEKMVKSVDTDKIRSGSDLIRKNLDRELERIDRECRPTVKFKPIDGPARVQLRSKIIEALALIDRWCELVDARPSSTSNYHLRQVEELRTVVRKHYVGAMKEIAHIESPLKSRVTDLFCRYLAFFEIGKGVEPSDNLGIADLLYGELLAEESIAFNPSDGTPTVPVPVETAIALSERKHLDFKGSAVLRAKQHDFANAERTIDFAYRRGCLSEPEADGARRAVDEQFKRSTDQVEQRVHEVLARLRAIYARGIVSTGDFENLRSHVPFPKTGPDDDLNHKFQSLDFVQGKIAEIEDARVAELRKRISGMAFANEKDADRINSAIAGGRFLVAEDLLDKVDRGEPLPEHEFVERRPLDRFFPKFVDEYVRSQENENVDLDYVLAAVEGRLQRGPVDGTKLPRNGAHESANIIRAWMSLVRGRRNKGDLESLFSNIGFTNPVVNFFRSRHAGQNDARLKCEPIADRGICQIPEFGSEANGNYRVALIANRTTGEAIVRRVSALPKDERSSVIVIFLGSLEITERKSLVSQLAFGRHGSPLVLDEVLVVFLALQPARVRLRVFFDCTCPFSHASPYNPDIADVPTEMFFGRTDERQRIQSTDDVSHLIFGGRRLGKTALLKSIQAEIAARSRNEIAIYMDLNGSGIGQPRPVDDIWKEIWKLLATNSSGQGFKRKGVVRAETIRAEIKNWVLAKPGRRILALLDEADVFLEADRQQKHKYRALSQFKELMDQTKRKFKVVFSGLHNVQRSSRDPNTPLAHLGAPIQIGPMLPYNGSSEIESLIRHPLEALGYRFSSTDDVTHIAMETNYYPSLVQQFCKELLRNLRESQIPEQRHGPPYVIPSETIRAVFDSPKTRDRLRNMFSWTIQLDPRYEFLTFLIARQGLTDDSLATLGVSLSDIRDVALLEWPKGFSKDYSYLTFEVLLEEMVGLGVLREVSDGDNLGQLHGQGLLHTVNHETGVHDRRFAIRTQSLRVLLGNEAEIERRYLDSKSGIIPELEPSRYRRTIGEINLSPLSAAQEELLLFDEPNVWLVFGTELSGLSLVNQSLQEAAREMEGAPSVGQSQKGTILNQLKLLLRSKSQDRVGFVVNLYDSWDPDVIEQSVGLVGKLDSRERRVRVVFVCDPVGAWGWLNQQMFPNSSDIRTTWLSPCSIDFAHLWLKDKEIEAFSDLGQSDDILFKPWPIVVSTAADAKHKFLEGAAKDTLSRHLGIVEDVMNVHDARPVLTVMSDYDAPMTIDDIDYCLTESIKGLSLSVDQLRNVVDWAMRLGVIERVDRGYRLDATYLVGIKALLET